MVSQEGGRWDVGAKDDSVYLARVSESDEPVFTDVITPDEARDLAGLLTKFADKAEGADDSAESDDDSEESDDTDDTDDSDPDKSSD